MHTAFKRLKPLALRSRTLALRKRRKKDPATPPTWREVRNLEFLRKFRKPLEIKAVCSKCGGPVSEAMITCPWCGTERRIHRGETRFTAVCPRCKRGVKSDWRFCPWCYGGAINPGSRLRYSDVRYTAYCSNPDCPDKLLMPYMRYCPWCRRKVTRRWPIAGSRSRCPRCGWGVLPEYWEFCPWCGKKLSGR